MKLNKKKCEVCKTTNRKILDAHHVIPRTDNRCTDLLDNLICVCSNCHRQIHAGQVIVEGRFNTTYGKIWFWHYDHQPYTVRPGVFLQKNGTALIVEA